MKNRMLLSFVSTIVAMSMVIPVSAQEPTLAPALPLLEDQNIVLAVSSPPLFASVGSPRQVNAIVEADTNPDGMNLLLLTSQSAVTLPMRLEDDGQWSGTIPAVNVVPPLLAYQVVALYSSTPISSPEYRLEIFSEIPAISAERTGLRRELILTGAWGDGPDQFGRQNDDESAVESPPSFAIDTTRNRIYILDTIHARVQVFDLAGHHQGSIALPSDSASDMVVDPTSGTLYILDQFQNTLYTLTPQVSAASPSMPAFHASASAVDLRAEPLNTQLAYEPTSNTVYVNRSLQGTYVPALIDPTSLARDVRRISERAGLPTSAGDVAVEVEGTSIVIGFSSNSRSAVRVLFDTEVLEVSDITAGQDGLIWAMVSLYVAEGRVETLLLRFDPALRQTQVAQVTATAVDDVTRRLVAVENGVILLESDNQELRLIRLQPSPNENVPTAQSTYLPMIYSTTAIAHNDLASVDQVEQSAQLDEVAVEIKEAANDSTMQAQYNPNWTRAQATSYAFKGLDERYKFGGSTFHNNNQWDANEGIDCSAYVAKAWAVSKYTAPMAAYHPYSTWHFYYKEIYWKRVDRRHPVPLSAWVYRKEAGGPGNHMGLFRLKRTDGRWLTYEARGAKYGVVRMIRSLSTLLAWNYHRIDRKNWGR